MNWRRILAALPATEWLSEYSRADLAGDALAALIVTVMLIPQSLAYALLAGLPPEVGLYASVAPLVAYAFLGSSRTLAVGPVAVISLMTAAALSEAVPPDAAPELLLGAALLLALLSGVLQLGLGLLRAGVIANFLSHPVISGFISASAILIAASQLKHLLGIRAGGDTLPELLPALAEAAGQTHFWTLGLGLAVMLFLYAVRRRGKALLQWLGAGRRLADSLVKASPAVAVIATTLAAFWLELDQRGMRLVGAIPSGLPPLSMPPLDLALIQDLLLPAALISLIGFVESVSVAQTLAAKRRQRIRPNQELVGLGAANLAAAFTGGYPVTGGFARSVVNDDAGARTPAAGLLTAVGIGAAALFLTPLLSYLPQATLAATIIVAVLALVDFGAMRRTLRYAKSDFAAMLATFLTVLVEGVEAGILVGVAVSTLLFLWRTSRPHYAVVGQVPGTEHFRNVLRHEVLTSPHVLSLRSDGSLYFANARFLEDLLLREIARQPAVSDVVLQCSAVNFIDASALESLEAVLERLKSAGVRLHLSEVKGPVMDRLRRSDFLQHLTGRIFLTQHAALAELDPAITAAADGLAKPRLSLLLPHDIWPKPASDAVTEESAGTRKEGVLP
jgi:SulP family sulfate permease